MSETKIERKRLEPVYVKEGQAVVWPSKPLTQEELDGHYRNEWIRKVLAITEEKRCIKFLVVKSKHSIATIDDKWGSGSEWEFSLGSQHFYSYRLSDLVHFLEKIWDSGATVYTLNGEAQVPEIYRMMSKEMKEKGS